MMGRNQPPDHNIIDFPFFLGELVGIFYLFRRNDGIVVGYLLVIHETFIVHEAGW